MSSHNEKIEVNSNAAPVTRSIRQTDLQKKICKRNLQKENLRKEKDWHRLVHDFIRCVRWQIVISERNEPN